jgi:hypothetical protein
LPIKKALQENLQGFFNIFNGFLFGVQKLKKLIQFWHDDDFCSSVFRHVLWTVIIHQRLVATSP